MEGDQCEGDCEESELFVRPVLRIQAPTPLGQESEKEISGKRQRSQVFTLIGPFSCF
jgi:hypothetical protein